MCMSAVLRRSSNKQSLVNEIRQSDEQEAIFGGESGHNTQTVMQNAAASKSGPGGAGLHILPPKGIPWITAQRALSFL